MSNQTFSKFPRRADTASPLVLPSCVLEEARAFFEDRGMFGLEGTAMIKANSAGSGLELVVPHQDAFRDAHGHVSVQVPRKGQMDLALALGVDEIYVVRIHSHPGDAFHSAADDANPVISYEGGISIVVPFFGLGLRRGLEACAVYVLRDGGRWVELPVGPDRDRYVVAEQKS
jgi:hypothetical protein